MMGLNLSAIALALASSTIITGVSGFVKGKSFDRFVVIWLENTDFNKAAGDPSLAALAKKGITLTNYYAITHPSEPNYVAAVGGSTFNIYDDGYNSVSASTTSIVDLLEAKGVSWSEYMEDMPSVGYTGEEYVNQQDGSDDYVRKHNPLVMYKSVNSKPSRLALTKTLDIFATELAANSLPQWMFITPNMQHDGHDTSVTTAGAWTKSFLTPLLSNPNFLNNTLVYVTFDECETYIAPNRVMGILLGDAVPKSLVGTSDATKYSHYSMLSTVEQNWALGSLGRGDKTATAFKLGVSARRRRG